eukprot:354338-Chlamydomonas_euryale.AAC.4
MLGRRGVGVDGKKEEPGGINGDRGCVGAARLARLPTGMMTVSGEEGMGGTPWAGRWVARCGAACQRDPRMDGL